jgi:predicted DNA-binding transcriptional regulator YafY
MPKRPDTHETVLLALEILRRIPKGRKVTATEIHQQLLSAGIERDLRTVQRQLDMLSGHFDIERDERSKPYGYRWKSGAKGFSMPLLTEQESLLLTLAEQHLRSLLPSNLMKSMNAFFETARQNLSPTSNVRLAREWLGKIKSISTNQPLLPPQIIPGVFEAVSNALYNNFWLTIEYKNVAGHISKSQVMPLGLAQQGHVLYLVCRYEGYDNERTLALHRMISAHETTLAFTRPKEFNLQKYDADGRFSFGEGKEIKLSFQIKKDFGQHLLETWLSQDQTVMEQDDYLLITATVVDSDRLDWWLNGFGENIINLQKRKDDGNN